MLHHPLCFASFLHWFLEPSLSILRKMRGNLILCSCLSQAANEHSGHLQQGMRMLSSQCRSSVSPILPYSPLHVSSCFQDPRTWASQSDGAPNNFQLRAFSALFACCFFCTTACRSLPSKIETLKLSTKQRDNSPKLSKGRDVGIYMFHRVSSRFYISIFKLYHWCGASWGDTLLSSCHLPSATSNLACFIFSAWMVPLRTEGRSNPSMKVTKTSKTLLYT